MAYVGDEGLKEYTVVGIDGCKGGWLAAVLSNEGLTLQWLDQVDAVMASYETADKHLIDIPIGLPENPREAAFRPDRAARALLKGKSSSVFPAPYRPVAQANSTDEAWAVNKAVGGNANYMTMGIRKAVAEVDLFLQNNPRWKNLLCECHPEVNFAMFNGGSPILASKKGEVGREMRLAILANWGIDREQFSAHPLFKRYKDDVVDAVCLTVVARLTLVGRSTTIPPPSEVRTDSTGLKMQMVAPVC